MRIGFFSLILMFQWKYQLDRSMIVMLNCEIYLSHCENAIVIKIITVKIAVIATLTATFLFIMLYTLHIHITVVVAGSFLPFL